jgi:low affinity Fe/Cu permease
MTTHEEDSKKKAMDRFFSSFAESASSLAATPVAFVIAIGFVLAWAITGPIFKYSSEWQMIMQGTPAILTFLLVFLIQNSQNRETRALQLKLNELIRVTKGAHTMMLNLEKLSETELKIMSGEYDLLAQEAHKRMARGESDQHVPGISLTQDMQKN